MIVRLFLLTGSAPHARIILGRAEQRRRKRSRSGGGEKEEEEEGEENRGCLQVKVLSYLTAYPQRRSKEIMDRTRF